MSKKLSLQLTQDYRSFSSGFSFDFTGNLIILSGVNGSGKSQLIDIISQRESHKNNAWSAYENYRLDYNHQNLWDYKESSERAKQILIDKYGEVKFKNKQITQTEFKDTLPSDFVWKSDDIFTNFIGELFFNYALDVYDAKAKAGEKGEKFDPPLLPAPPWKQLNDLLPALGFECRFKDNYYVRGLQINEQP